MNSVCPQVNVWQKGRRLVSGYLYKGLRWFIYALVALIVLRTFFIGLYHIPTYSMYPTLIQGDRLMAPKWVYGYSGFSFGAVKLPSSWFGTQRLGGDAPKRGDIVVFAHPKTNVTLIKRLIGLPGETIEFVQERLYINGTLMPRRYLGDFNMILSANSAAQYLRHYEEALPNGVRYEIVEMGEGSTSTDSMGPYKVPVGHYFFVGDNRDFSRDSRFSDVSFVAQSHLIGRADMLLFSIPGCNDTTLAPCAKRRFFATP